ncbi:MAG: hypothetical protein WB443_14275 [Nitrososphaeraceae archaeon]
MINAVLEIFVVRERRMIGWMDGGQICIALERSSGESSKDVMSISVSHLIWKEEIMLSKMKYQNQNGRQYGILNKHNILIKK